MKHKRRRLFHFFSIRMNRNWSFHASKRTQKQHKSIMIAVQTTCALIFQRSYGFVSYLLKFTKTVGMIWSQTAVEKDFLWIMTWILFCSKYSCYYMALKYLHIVYKLFELLYSIFDAWNSLRVISHFRHLSFCVPWKNKNIWVWICMRVHKWQNFPFLSQLIV